MSTHEEEPARGVTQQVEPAPRTALGRRLMELRAQFVASGEPLLDWEGVAREVRSGRAEAEAEEPDCPR